MPKYYIGNMPFGHDDKDELMHYGRKGMKWGKDIFGDVASAVSNTARNVGGSVARTASSAGRAIGRTATSAGRAVGRAAVNAYGSARTAAGNTSRSVSKFVDRKITGKSAKGRRDFYKEIADDRKNEADRANSFMTTYGANSFHARKVMANRDSENFWRTHQREAQSDYDKTLAGKIDKVKEMPGRALDAASKFVDKNITGKSAKNRVRSHNEAAERHNSMARTSNVVSRGVNDFSIKERNKAAGEKRQAERAQKQYDKSLAGKLDKAKNSAGEAISNTGKKVKQTASNVASGAKNAARKAKETASKVASGAKNVASNAGRKAKETARKAKNKGKQFLDNMFGRNKQKETKKKYKVTTVPGQNKYGTVNPGNDLSGYESPMRRDNGHSKSKKKYKSYV